MGQSYPTGMGTQAAASQQSSYPAEMGSSQPFQQPSYSQASGYKPQDNQAAGYQQPSLASQAYSSVAPQARGPYEESMSADDLRLAEPQGESFQPDSNLNFVTATPPRMPEETYGAVMEAGQEMGQDAGQASGSWYYPGSVTSQNKFYVQTFSGLKTVAGCNYGGYLPLWSDINSAGNFYVYEWYPGQFTPSVRWWGWTWPGFKKGWFMGDVPGWHILSYNCRDWSNYVYIYVWPTGSGSYSPGYGQSPAYSPGAATVTTATTATVASSGPIPAGAPTPPDLNAESLVLPDFKLFQPVTGQGSPGQGGYTTTATTVVAATATSAPGIASYDGYNAGYTTVGPGQMIYSANYPAKSAYPAQSAYMQPSSYAQMGAYSASNPLQAAQAQKGCTACAEHSGYASPSYTAPPGQMVQTYQAVFPKPSTCRCNEYYAQAGPNKLSTVAGVRCGEWMPLWSKISRPGIYWSFEWTMCGSQAGYYCQPEVRNFGYKNAGWTQTWFSGNKPGWHILSYYSGDWSNYVYIYVWPVS